jgi:large subunit ribosomal protein L10
MAENKPKTHISERKKKIVKELGTMMGRKTLLIASIKNIPCSKLQEIRKKLRGKAEMKIAKKNLIDFALEHAKNPALKDLENYVKEDSALLFSDEDAFELSAFLSENKSKAKAKAGQIATDDIIVEAGATDLPPGPDISVLSGVGLKVKIEGGKIAIQDSKVLVKKGEKVKADVAAILAKLNIMPFKIGLEPLAAFSEGKIYSGIKVDKEEMINELKIMGGKAIAFAVTLDYPTKETLSFVLGKAQAHEKALAGLIKSNLDSN